MNTSIRIAMLAALLLAPGPPALAAEGQTSKPSSAPGLQGRPAGQIQQIQPGQRTLPGGRTAPAQPMGIKRGVLKLNKTTEKGMWKLPDDQLIEIEGKQVPLGEVRRRAESDIKRSRAAIPPSKLPELNAKLEAEQQAMLDEQAAKVKAQLAKLAQGGGPSGQAARLKAIQQEALQIQQRQKTATPAQRAKDEARARKLLSDYESLE